MSIFTTSNRTKSGKIETHMRWWLTLIISMVLSLGTWNPTGYHFVGYISGSDPLSGFKPFMILLFIAMWVMAIKAVLQSIQVYGALIAAGIIASFVYGLMQIGWLDTSKWSTFGWIATLGIGLLIFIGLNASIVWKKLTGIYTTDVTDED